MERGVASNLRPAQCRLLGETQAAPDELKSLLVPYPAEDMAIWAVDKRVGNVNNKDPSLIEPPAAA